MDENNATTKRRPHLSAPVDLPASFFDNRTKTEARIESKRLNHGGADPRFPIAFARALCFVYPRFMGTAPVPDHARAKACEPTRATHHHTWCMPLCTTPLTESRLLPHLLFFLCCATYSVTVSGAAGRCGRRPLMPIMNEALRRMPIRNTNPPIIQLAWSQKATRETLPLSIPRACWAMSRHEGATTLSDTSSQQAFACRVSEQKGPAFPISFFFYIPFSLFPFPFNHTWALTPP